MWVGVLVTQLRLTLCDPMDCSLPGFSGRGIFQARILEWVAISSSKGSSPPRIEPHVSCVSCIGASWEAPRVCLYGSLISNSTLQFSSVAQSCPTLCDPMNRSTPGLPVHHHLLEFAHTHVHRVRDAIQPSHPLSSPSPPAPNPSQHQSLFQ